MSGSRKKFSRDFKIKVVEAYQSGVSAVELSRQFEIHGLSASPPNRPSAHSNIALIDTLFARVKGQAHGKDHGLAGKTTLRARDRSRVQKRSGSRRSASSGGVFRSASRA